MIEFSSETVQNKVPFSIALTRLRANNNRKNNYVQQNSRIDIRERRTGFTN